MRYPRLGTMLIALVAFISWATPSPGFEGSFKVPCEIFYRGEVPFVVICTVVIKITGTRFVELAKTPNGRTFVIENGKSDWNRWYLDHEAAMITSPEPMPCYKNNEVKICL